MCKFSFFFNVLSKLRQWIYVKKVISENFIIFQIKFRNFFKFF